MRIHLVMPTIGRVDEIYQFISSVGHDSRVELFISDQNQQGILNPIALINYSNFLKVNYSHSVQKGLSLNRNLLLDKIKSKEGIVAFPDDDCLYYNDTLELVCKFFANNSDVDVLIGCIYDRKESKYLFKSWPKKRKNVNKFNVYFLASSITIFIRLPIDRYFDVNLGAGTNYGSCEDPDFLYSLLKQGKKIVYDPSIQVWHPAPNFQEIPLSKVKSYSKGFGYFIRKDIDFFKIILLFLLIVKKISQFLLQNKKFQKKYFKSFFSGLYSGLLGK